MPTAELQTVASPVEGLTVTAAQMELIKRTVAKDANGDELKLYLYDCARHGVHPLDKLLHFTKRGGKYTPITSIDFMRSRAAETGEYAGNDDAQFGGPTVDMYPGQACVTVWRLVKGQRCGFTATARWSEYKPEQNDFMWRKMPHTMLAKCAEALALRKGFPQQLAGLYSTEEMDQASYSDRQVSVTPVPPGAGVMTHPSSPERGEPRDNPERLIHQDREDPPVDTTLEPDPPDGWLRIMRVESESRKSKTGKGFTKYTITLSTGEQVTTISDWMASLATNYCKDRTPVRIKTEKTKWGVDLKKLMAGDETETKAEPLPYDGDVPF